MMAIKSHKALLAVLDIRYITLTDQVNVYMVYYSMWGKYESHTISNITSEQAKAHTIAAY